MNQMMNLERVGRVELVRKIAKLRQNQKTSADELDKEIAISVANCLRTSHNSELKQIRCEFRTGILTIHGQVSSYYLKQLAQEAVRRLAGVERIVNHLDVVHAHSNPGKPETH